MRVRGGEGVGGDTVSDAEANRCDQRGVKPLGPGAIHSSNSVYWLCLFVCSGGPLF